MRKKYFNQMEDMKGKIRVYARVRPMLKFEKDKGQKEALIIPDELSLEHMWKDKKREYSFDAVFSPNTSKDKVRLACPDWLHSQACNCITGLGATAVAHSILVQKAHVSALPVQEDSVAAADEPS